MTPARKIVKMAQALAEKDGYEWIAEGFRNDSKAFWEKLARAAIFDGKSPAVAAEELYHLALKAEL